MAKTFDHQKLISCKEEQVLRREISIELHHKIIYSVMTRITQERIIQSYSKPCKSV